MQLGCTQRRTLTRRKCVVVTEVLSAAITAGDLPQLWRWTLLLLPPSRLLQPGYGYLRLPKAGCVHFTATEDGRPLLQSQELDVASFTGGDFLSHRTQRWLLHYSENPETGIRSPKKPRSWYYIHHGTQRWVSHFSQEPKVGTASLIEPRWSTEASVVPEGGRCTRDKTERWSSLLNPGGGNRVPTQYLKAVSVPLTASVSGYLIVSIKPRSGEAGTGPLTGHK